MVSFDVFLVTTALAVFLGVGVTYVFFRTVRLRNRRGTASADPLTDVAERLVGVLATAGFVIDSSLAVVRASNSAIALGLVSGRVIRSPEIRRLVRLAKDSETVEEREFELVLAAEAKPHILKARAVAIGNGLVLVLVEDHTEANDFEAVRRDFIANVTHEIKTPIGAISLLSEALEGALDDPAQLHRFAESLRREATRLSNLVNEIIQLSRVESSDILASATPTNVGSIVREALERTVVIAESKAIEVSAKFPDDVFVMGDTELLTVAVKNLIENAIQYSDAGSKVGVGVTTRNGHVDIDVTDQGVGIPADEQARVFERFYRVDASRDRTTGGTGLGLSLVKHIALTHRGEITLFSQPGVGSTFTIRLPRLIDTNKEKPHE